MAQSTSIPGNPGFPLAVAILALLALVLREYYVLATVVETPVRGDVREYVAYAWNLLNHGVFSQVAPGDGAPVPDAYRSPGYPVFLALAMSIGGTADGGWYPLALHAQAVAGALTVLLTAVAARECMPDRWALLAAGLLAIWPHHIAATGVLLSEVVLGLLLAAAVLALLRTYRSSRPRLAAAVAGLALACAALVNPVLLLFPLVAALLVLLARGRAPALTLLAAFGLVIGGWSLRTASLPDATRGDHRAAINFVQGSWPNYHAAFHARLEHESAREVLALIAEETRVTVEDPVAGAAMIWQRFTQYPGLYLRWYLWEKPYLLWAWDIRMGIGDVYFQRVAASPLETNPLLRATKAVLKAANPLVFVLSGAWAVLLVLGARVRLRNGQVALLSVAALAVYLTLVHWLFQAEPRYAVAYRPLQFVLLASALQALGSKLAALRARGEHQAV